MAIRRITEVGNPVLRSAAAEVPAEAFGSPEMDRLVTDLVDTMRDYDGVGIAAPQIGVPYRLFAIEVRTPDESRDAVEFPLTIVVNPQLELLEERGHAGWEGCLSVEGLRGLVPRAHRVVLRGWAPSSEPFELELAGFPAVVAQHEHDHLDGVLYLDRMPDLRSLSTVRELGRRMEPSAD